MFLMGGAFRLERVTFDSCTATTGDAGGVYIWDNYGNNPITATISQCTFSRSTTAGRGGGIAIAGAQNAVTGCTFLQNSATTTGAALYHIGGHLTISDSLFAANSGGYTFYFEGASVAELTNDTIVDNTEGGVSTNNAAQVTLVNDTIANNQCNVQSCYNGVGIRQNSGGTLTLTNTILFHNIQNGMDGNCSANGSVTSLGHNLTDSAANARIGPIASDLILTDPLLGPLADNGGPTQTVAITIDSPAYNAADDAVCPPTDERDVPRPAAGRCDIGAFEVQ